MLVLQYKAHLINKGLAEATVNRRLAAIKALCKYGRKLGRCDYSLEDVQAEKVQGYRDTSGVAPEVYRKMLDKCDRPTIKGIRDYAILRLFWDNALRRGELVKLNVEDFDPLEKRIRIFGKGKGKQFVFMDLSDRTVEAVREWLNTRGELKPSDPLFTSLMPGKKTQRLTGDGLWRIVKEYAQKAGITRNFSPHRIRHSAITAALDVTDGDIRSTVSLSRNTAPVLMRYDDNRRKAQKRITNLLSDLV